MADMKKPMPKNTSTRQPVVKPKTKASAMPKNTPTKNPVVKPTVKAPAKKPAPLKGPAAIKELQRQVSPKGVKKSEEGAKKGLDKKYPGLYKNSK